MNKIGFFDCIEKKRSNRWNFVENYFHLEAFDGRKYQVIKKEGRHHFVIIERNKKGALPLFRTLLKILSYSVLFFSIPLFLAKRNHRKKYKTTIITSQKTNISFSGSQKPKGPTPPPADPSVKRKKDLEALVKTRLADGFPESDIKQFLGLSGYKAEEIEEAFGKAKPVQDLVLAPIALTQFNVKEISGVESKSACAFIAAGYLSNNQDATPDVIRKVLVDNKESPEAGVELAQALGKFPNLIPHAAPDLHPDLKAAGMLTSQILYSDWAKWIEEKSFSDILSSPQYSGLLIRAKGMSFGLRKTHGRFEFFDSHGDHLVTGTQGAYVKRFGSSKDLKVFLKDYHVFKDNQLGSHEAIEVLCVNNKI